VGVVIDAATGKTHLFQEVARADHGLTLVRLSVRGDRLGDLRADALHRVHRVHRPLEDDGGPGPTERPELAGGQLEDVLPLEEDPSPYLGVLRMQAQDGACDR
jgi:hypothetical protein